MRTVRLYYGSIDGFISDATPFHGYVVEHPQGLVLVDTGFGATLGGTGRIGAQTAHGPSFPWVRRPTVEALADHGYDPADVAYIINTHLGDHSGDNQLFAHATVIVQQPEIEFIRASFPEDDHPRRSWDFPGAKLEPLAGEDAEVLPGIRCLFTPGHTPGHQSIVVDHDDTTELFVGDAVYTSDLWDHPEKMTPEHATWNAQGAGEHWFESADKLKAIAADVVHFAHDPAIWRP
jgi:N-acyl homoserine lactone hydrolase